MNPKWRWHQMIHRMIGELNETEAKIYKKNYISCLNWLSYFYERDKVQEALNKQNK